MFEQHFFSMLRVTDANNTRHAIPYGSISRFSAKTYHVTEIYLTHRENPIIVNTDLDDLLRNAGFSTPVQKDE